MHGMGRLEPRNERAEFRLVQPFRQMAAQATFALRGRETFGAMQRVARERRRALAGDDEHQTMVRTPRLAEKAEEAVACHLYAGAVQIEPRLDLRLTAHQALRGASVETRQLR